MRGGPVGSFVLVVVVWVVAVAVIRWLYRRLRAELTPLQREVAVQMYVQSRHFAATQRKDVTHRA